MSRKVLKTDVTDSGKNKKSVVQWRKINGYRVHYAKVLKKSSRKKNDYGVYKLNVSKY